MALSALGRRDDKARLARPAIAWVMAASTCDRGFATLTSVGAATGTTPLEQDLGAEELHEP